MIETLTATVYKSTLGSRRYFTLKAALRSEARALLDEYDPYFDGDVGEWGQRESPPEGWRCEFHGEAALYLIDLVVEQIINKEINGEDAREAVFEAIYNEARKYEEY